MVDYVHLTVHSEYSLVDSIVRVPMLVEQVAQIGMPAVGVTDQSNVFAMVKLYRVAIKKGVKPIIGADVLVAQTLDDADPSRLTLLCMNLEGFRNLSQLLTLGYTDGHRNNQPILLKKWLEQSKVRGLIALSGGQFGEVGRALLGSNPDFAFDILEEWNARFPGRFYLELHRVGRKDEDLHVPRAVTLASQCAVPIVATNDVRFLRREDFEVHEARICIQQGRTLDDPARPREYTEEQFLKSPVEMAEVFSDLPEALANSIQIAQRCSLQIVLGETFLPDLSVPEGHNSDSYLREMALSGLASRYPTVSDNAVAKTVDHERRLSQELDVICEMGFSGYFLIVADFIRWARENDIPVGPGRGSGAGSLVAYVLGITDLDPIEHDLLFERFLNPERVSMPDFDIDFCIDGRDRVIDYVSDRYGRDRVSQIITFGTMAARAVVRDVGRVLGMPYGYVDRVAKLIPFVVGITLEGAINGDKELKIKGNDELKSLYKSEEEVKTLIDLAQQLEGLVRNAGTHAGGIVIAPKPLTHFMPLYSESGETVLTQFDKNDVEALGLVKFDFLGLKTLTIIDRAIKSINLGRIAKDKEPLQAIHLPSDDSKTYDLLQRGSTSGVFQLESFGMRRLIKELQPNCLDDLIALLALFRPGPLDSGMVEDFIDRRHGQNSEPINYFHPILKPILKATYGVILYQEQVMQIARVMAGYSMGGADLLRRAMGKKKPEEMEKQRSIFLKGSQKQSIDEVIAGKIFDLMEKFAGYGFNKSHSAAYALIAYQTAWLKAHYPADFMASVLTADMDNTDKLFILKYDCSQNGIKLEIPDINSSFFEFTAIDTHSILYGLGAIKGVGQRVVEDIVKERNANGIFTDLADFCRRVKNLNKRVLEALARSGALDGLGENRATLVVAIPNVLRLAEHATHARESGQGALFDEQEEAEELGQFVKKMPNWSLRERLSAERESLGLYLTGHPFEDYAEHCAHFTHGSIRGFIRNLPESVSNGNSSSLTREVTIAGLVVDIFRRNKTVCVILDDNTERLEILFFDDSYNTNRHLITKDSALIVDGKLQFDNYRKMWQVTAKSVKLADQKIEENARRITIQWPKNSDDKQFLLNLKETLRPFTDGDCEVCLEYTGPTARVAMTFGDRWTVKLTRELREQLGVLLGADRFSVHYPKYIS
ncbi:MAG: DNA polymerase III subunit alpha [Rhodospirillaceae bacterium]|nr:DNA polymerase III subunit alpha [Rhodospirillaceae bacterium]